MSFTVNQNKGPRTRRKHSREFKFKVALEALKEQKTIAAICREFGIHETLVNKWKKQLKELGSEVFEDTNPTGNKEAELEARIKELNEYIGELSVENKFFKKNLKS